jgi:hypothetical protein
MLVLAAALTAPRQPVNSRCLGAPLITGDIITAPGGKTAVIRAIAGIYDAHRLVGWVYNTRGQRLAQLLPDMSMRDQHIIGVALGRNDRYSGIMRIASQANPWAGRLVIRYCKPREMVSGKYSRNPY